MPGFEFSCFQFHILKKTPKNMKMMPNIESNWNQDLEIKSLEFVLNAMKTSAKNCSKKVKVNSPRRPGRDRGVLNKGDT